MSKELISTFIILIFTTAIFAQEKVIDTLNTGEINVVKPYTPTISDAFKLKENPTINTKNIGKDSVTYTINSVPVASTFTPTKGKAQSVVRERMDKIYENYIAVGFGNYTTPYLEAHLHSSTSRYNDFGAFIKHISSKDGIKDAIIDHNYSDTKLDLYYKQFERDYNWEINAGAHHQINNWYGLPQETSFLSTFLDAIDTKQRYLNIFVCGKFNYEDSFFKGGKFALNQFSDNYKSSEFHFLIAPKLEFPISSELINTTAIIEIISGKFNQDYANTGKMNYSFLKLGINPNFEVLRDDLTVNLGVKLYYSFDLENKTNALFVYPNVTVSYKLLEDTVIVYTGITGDLHQNSYRQFVQDNPFVSPTLNIQQTDQQYNGFLGIKGKLASNVGYNFKASYQSERNKPLYIQNPTKTNGTTSTTFAYEAGNSFGIVYDDVKTLGIIGELNVSLSKEFKFGTTIEFNNYSTTLQAEAWNLPTLKATVFVDYNAKKWCFGSNLYFVGERYDFVTPFSGVGAIIDLDSYVDLNLNTGYVFTDRLTAFAKANNVLSSNYERYTNFEVQGFQILAGIIYKFDF